MGHSRCLAASIVVACLAFSLASGCGHRNEETSAKEGIANALIAIRNVDPAGYRRYLYSKSGEYPAVKHPAMCRRLLAYESKALQLNKMSDSDVRDSVRVVHGVARDLLVSMIAFNQGKQPGKGFDALNLMAITYNVPGGKGKEMFSVAVEEDGAWKLGGCPYWTAALLRYKRVEDAKNDPNVGFPGR